MSEQKRFYLMLGSEDMSLYVRWIAEEYPSRVSFFYPSRSYATVEELQTEIAKQFARHAKDLEDEAERIRLFVSSLNEDSIRKIMKDRADWVPQCKPEREDKPLS